VHLIADDEGDDVPNLRQAAPALHSMITSSSDSFKKVCDRTGPLKQNKKVAIAAPLLDPKSNQVFVGIRNNQDISESK